MKKISVLLLSTLVIFFVSCSKDVTEPTEPSLTENVSVTSVVPASAAADATPITEEIFEEKAKTVILEDLKKLFANLPLNQLNFLNNPSTPNYNINSRAVTIDQLQESFAGITEAFQSTQSEDGTAGSITGSWNGPVGEIDFGENATPGLTAKINALGLNLDLFYGASEAGISLTANGGVRVGFSAGLDFTKSSEEETAIKNAKLSAGYTASISKVSATADLAMMESDIIDASVPTSTYEAMLGGITKLSGNLSYEALIDSAAYFEIPSDGNIYNGILKTNSNASFNLALSKEALDELVGLIDSMMSQGYQFGSEDLAVLEKYITLKFDVDVYDAAGNKLFTYLSAASLSEIFDLVN